MTSPLIQLLIRLTAILLPMASGWLTSHVSSETMGIFVAIGGTILTYLLQWVHSKGHRKQLVEWYDLVTRQLNWAPLPQPPKVPLVPPTVTNAIKKVLPVFLVCSLLVTTQTCCVAPRGGQGLTPIQQLAQIEQTYDMALIGLTVAVDTGALTKEDVQKYQPVLDAIEAAIMAAKSSILDGNESAAPLKAALAALQELQPLLHKTPRSQLDHMAPTLPSTVPTDAPSDEPPPGD